MNHQSQTSNFATATEHLANREATAERSKKLAPDSARRSKLANLTERIFAMFSSSSEADFSLGDLQSA